MTDSGAATLGNARDTADATGTCTGAAGARAADAGIKQLVYYHLVPVPGNALAEKMFARGLPAEIILARDLHTFDLPPNSAEIFVHEP